MKDHEIDEVLNEAARSPHSVDAGLLQRICGMMPASIKPVRPLPPRWALEAGLLVVCALVAIGGAARAGFFGFEKMSLVERAVIFSILLVLGWRAARTFVAEMIPGSRRPLSSQGLLAAIVAVLFCLFALMFQDYQTQHFFSAGIVCLAVGVGFAIPAGLLAWLLLRRGYAVNPVSAGLVAGILGGLAGLAMLELHCPNFQATHILVWHIAVLPLSGYIGALLGFGIRGSR